MHTLPALRIALQDDADFKKIVATTLKINVDTITDIRILKKSLDARGRQKYWEYSLEVYTDGESPQVTPINFPKINWQGDPPLIIGAGPAGLFAAWTFLQHGIKPILFERGERMHPRMQKISRFWRKGELDINSNVCNGEGGAGTFSDGKLITRIKSEHIPHVLQTLVNYGAPPEISYVYNPHIGSNRIRTVIHAMTNDLMAQGATLHFNAQVTSLDLSGQAVQGIVLANGQKVSGHGLILACGHSAGDFFHTLQNQGVFIEPKSFALGLRIEHPQKYINTWQLGSEVVPDEIRAAQYKLTSYSQDDNVGVYTFCMCPGGYVVSSTTDPDTLVVNGMSNYHRNSPFANAAIVASINKEQIPGEDVFKMLHFQRDIEKKAFALSKNHGDGKQIPAQRLEDFLARRMGKNIVGTSSPSGAITANISEILPDWVYQHLCAGILDFEKRRKGFIHKDAVLHAVESRTSSPIRITRNPETFESINTKGLFPCGEGPGYAGGITSAAVDGIKAALGWIAAFTPLATPAHAKSPSAKAQPKSTPQAN